MNNKLFTALSEIFKAQDDEYLELDDSGLSSALEPYGYNEGGMYQIDINNLLTKNGFVKREIFNQVVIFQEHLYRCVVTAEYSDNTGNTYYRFFSTIEEYNEWVCVDLTGVR